MYVLIEKDNMLLLHKHSDFHVLANLAFIECHDSSYSIFPIDRDRPFIEFTSMELKILYRNITQEESNFTDGQLRKILSELAGRASKTNVNINELDAQAEYMNTIDEKKGWKYSKGARRPFKLKELFPLESKKVNSDKEKENEIVENMPNQKTRKQPIQRKGTLKDKIWNTADELWQDYGCPDTKEALLSLRKKIMKRLEADGIPRIKSSSQLGQWQKVILEKVS